MSLFDRLGCLAFLLCVSSITKSVAHCDHKRQPVTSSLIFKIVVRIAVTHLEKRKKILKLSDPLDISQSLKGSMQAGTNYHGPVDSHGFPIGSADDSYDVCM